MFLWHCFYQKSYDLYVFFCQFCLFCCCYFFSILWILLVPMCFWTSFWVSTGLTWKCVLRFEFWVLSFELCFLCLCFFSFSFFFSLLFLPFLFSYFSTFSGCCLFFLVFGFSVFRLILVIFKFRHDSRFLEVWLSSLGHYHYFY